MRTLAFTFTAAARLVRAVTSSGLLGTGRPVPAGWQRALRDRWVRDAQVTDEHSPLVSLVYGIWRALRGRLARWLIDLGFLLSFLFCKAKLKKKAKMADQPFFK